MKEIPPPFMRPHSILSIIITLGLVSLAVPASAAFPDVPASHANLEAINYVQQQGIVQGYPDGTFRPDQTINRAEFIKIIAKSWVAADPGTGHMRGIYPCFFHETEETFLQRVGMIRMKDVDFTAWYAGYLCYALGSGIISGYPDGTIRPGQTINFAEAAKIIANTFELDPATNTDPWYKGYVTPLEQHSMIPLSITSFDQSITRCQMAEMIYRLQAGVTSKPSRTYEELAGTVTQKWQTVRMGGYSVEVPQAWTVGSSTSFNTHTSYRSFMDESGKEIARFYCPPPEVGYQGSYVAESKSRQIVEAGSRSIIRLDRRDAVPGIDWVVPSSYHLHLMDALETWGHSCQLNSWLMEGETGSAPADVWQHMFESASIAR